MLVTRSDDSAINSFCQQLSEQFSIKNLGLASTFIGIQIVQYLDGYLLHQNRYAIQVLGKTGMLQPKSVRNPLPSKFTQKKKELA